MITPILERIKSFIRRIIKKIRHHDYGCCSNIWEDCRKCSMSEIQNKRLILKNKKG